MNQLELAESILATQTYGISLSTYDYRRCSQNGHCHVIVGDYDTHAACACDSKHVGAECTLSCPGIGTPCSGNGVCKEQENQAVCLCNSGYYGPNCSFASNSTSCGNGKCVGYFNDAPLCICDEGYVGKACDMKCSACEHGSCVAVEDKAVCLCVDGFEGKTCGSQLPHVGSEKQKTETLFIALIAVGAVALVSIISLIVVLLRKRKQHDYAPLASLQDE